jgi:hypothetical protein
VYGARMGNLRHGIPTVLAAQLRDHLGLRAAVETGTYLGDSAAQLAAMFDRVWTVELAEQFWEEARARHGGSGVEFVLGASQEVLPRIVQEAGGPALFWLDGHWSGGDTAGADRECPVLDEIAAIDAGPHGAGSAILIDDARLFCAPPPPPHDPGQWPTLMQVADAARRVHDRHVTVVEDVIVAVPQSAKPVVDGYANRPTPSAPRWRRVLARA